MIDIGLKFTKSAYITPNFVCKKSIWVPKNAEFHADFKLVDGQKKMFRKKSYMQCLGKMCKNENTKISNRFFTMNFLKKHVLKLASTNVKIA